MRTIQRGESEWKFYLGRKLPSSCRRDIVSIGTLMNSECTTCWLIQHLFSLSRITPNTLSWLYHFILPDSACLFWKIPKLRTSCLFSQFLIEDTLKSLVFQWFRVEVQWLQKHPAVNYYSTFAEILRKQPKMSDPDNADTTLPWVSATFINRLRAGVSFYISGSSNDRVFRFHACSYMELTKLLCFKDEFFKSRGTHTKSNTAACWWIGVLNHSTVN